MTLSQVVDGVTDLDSALFNPIIDAVNNLFIFSPLHYDGVGDGVADDLTPMQSAIDAAVAVGGIVDIGPKDWYVSDTLTADGDFSMIGTGRILYDRANIGLQVTPTWATAHSITAQTTETYPATIGRTCAKLTVSEWSSYSRGDIVLVYSTDAIPSADLASGTYRGALHMVAGTATGYVYLVGMLDTAYTTSAKIQKHPMVKVRIDGPTFTANGDPTAAVAGRARAALELNGCANSYVRATFQDCWSRGLFALSCYGCAFDITARNLRDDITNIAYGYGVDLCSACRLCTVRVNATNCRHAFTTNIYTASSGDGFYGSPRNIVVHDSFADACSSTGFDTHGGAYDITFDNCHVVNQNVGPAGGAGQYDAFVVRAADVTIQNCSQTGLGNFLYDYGANVDYGKSTVTRVIDSSARTTTAQYAVESDRALLRSAGTTSSVHRIEFHGMQTYNRDIYDTSGNATVSFDNCLLRNADLIRMKAGTTMEIRNTRRTWEISGSMEPILIRGDCTLNLHGYQTQGTHSNTSIVRGTSGSGATWTVNAAFVSSPDTTTFKSDDGSGGTWDVNDIAVTVT